MIYKAFPFVSFKCYLLDDLENVDTFGFSDQN